MRHILPLLLFATLLASAPAARAHCEVPCGIYDDELRVEMIREDAATIEKAMAQIGENADSANQQIRWVVTKEEHATKIQNVVWQYFMTQRIKPDAKNYEQKLALLHAMLRDAMKCKQTTDAAHVQSLRGHLDEFAALYFEEHEH
jgi:nickel superoxide dismutase